jgi:hypothetical protein
MRLRDPADAPFLFNNPRPPLSDNGTEHPFESILRFAYGYRDIITSDNARLNTMLPDGGRWGTRSVRSGIVEPPQPLGPQREAAFGAMRLKQAAVRSRSPNPPRNALPEASPKTKPETTSWPTMAVLIAAATSRCPA